MLVQTPPDKSAHPSVREEESLLYPIKLEGLTPEAAKKIYSQIRGLSGPTRKEIERLAGVVQK